MKLSLLRIFYYTYLTLSWLDKSLAQRVRLEEENTERKAGSYYNSNAGHKPAEHYYRSQLNEQNEAC